MRFIWFLAVFCLFILGIENTSAENPKRKNFYEILEVSQNASQQTIKSSFRKLAMKWHPDMYPPGSKEYSEAEEKFKEINEANEVLSDTDKRRDYDSRLQMGTWNSDIDSSPTEPRNSNPTGHRADFHTMMFASKKVATLAGKMGEQGKEASEIAEAVYKMLTETFLPATDTIHLFRGAVSDIWTNTWLPTEFTKNNAAAIEGLFVGSFAAWEKVKDTHPDIYRQQYKEGHFHLTKNFELFAKTPNSSRAHLIGLQNALSRINLVQSTHGNRGASASSCRDYYQRVQSKGR